MTAFKVKTAEDKKMLRKWKRKFGRLLDSTQSFFANGEQTRLEVANMRLRMDHLFEVVRRESDRDLKEAVHARQRLHANHFVRFGAKCFSQSDEDGLTLEIIRRLALSRGLFIEIGVGDGRENNTLVLLAAGWRGVWFGAEDLTFDPSGSERLIFKKSWITRENIVPLVLESLSKFKADKVDVVSVDVDGNDFYLCETLLNNEIRPELFIVEYNAKFPPDIEFVVPYEDHRKWMGDDFFGASLQSISNLFIKHGYKLICCNAATGANAFFVREEHFSLFPETPTSLREIYVPPYYDLILHHGHPASVDTIRHIVNHPWGGAGRDMAKL